jgi:hypothetical protein
VEHGEIQNTAERWTRRDLQRNERKYLNEKQRQQTVSKGDTSERFPSSCAAHVSRNLNLSSINFAGSSLYGTAIASLPFTCVKGARGVSSFFALFLISLSATRSWATTDNLNSSDPEVPAAVPTLVQHVATGMDRYPINTLTVNCLIQSGQAIA